MEVFDCKELDVSRRAAARKGHFHHEFNVPCLVRERQKSLLPVRTEDKRETLCWH